MGLQTSMTGWAESTAVKASNWQYMHNSKKIVKNVNAARQSCITNIGFASEFYVIDIFFSGKPCSTTLKMKRMT